MIWQDDELEDISCVLCGKEDTKNIITRRDGLKVVECLHCGLAYLNPRPKASSIARLYSTQYFSSTDDCIGYSAYLGSENIGSLTIAAKERLAFIKRHCLMEGKRLLEVGCATGEFCEAARESGATVVGCDYSGDVIRIARDRFPYIQFYAGPVQSLALEPASFDIIVAFEVMEHVLDPLEWLEYLNNLLVPGGLLVLSTPNYSYGKSLGFNNWSGFQGSFEHLYFFSIEFIRKFAEKANFEVISSYSVGIGKLQHSYLRSALVLFFRSIRILSFLRRIKRRMKKVNVNWTWTDSGHSLYVIMKKMTAPKE